MASMVSVGEEAAASQRQRGRRGSAKAVIMRIVALLVAGCAYSRIGLGFVCGEQWLQ
jgi:hypothetical protein